MKSWITSVGGMMLAIGTPLSQSDDSTIKSLGVALVAIGGLIMGLAAKDWNVTGGTK